MAENGGRSGARRGSKWSMMMALLLSPLLIALFLLWLPLYFLYSLILHLLIWIFWNSRGKDVLLVTSESPVWSDYIAQQIQPHVADRAIILNWSHRKRWSPSLANAAFHHFAGSRDFNPLAVVFRPCRRAQVFRFWSAFRDWKHGNPDALNRIQDELFRALAIDE